MTDAMKDVSHTNPYTDESFGETVVFRRGQTVAADGGERTDGSRSSSGRRSDGGRREESEKQTMKDVSHTPPTGDGAMRVFERGTEGRDETV